MSTFRLILALIVATTVISCARTSSPVYPSPATLDRIERQLSNDPCIGDLSRWARYYRFDSKNGEIDMSKILFDFNEQKSSGEKAGRYLRPPRDEKVFELDDRNNIVAFGTYYLPSGKVHIAFCGPNFPE